MVDLTTIIEDMKVFKKYYSSARLVDPLRKEVIDCDGTNSALSQANKKHEQCHRFWATGHVCLNCISMRAALENDTFVKFEDVGDKIYMITALPVRLGENVVALELLKDVTNQDMVDTLIGRLGEEGPLDIRASIARLNELVVKDGLTRIYNRRFIAEKLPAEIIKARLENVPLSLIMADIDNFKQVNDEYGHVAGDEVLIAFANGIVREVRKDSCDWAARYGGEEFLVCLENCDEDNAYKVAQRMRKAVEDMEIPTSSGQLKITASFGVYTYHDQDIDMPQLIEAVDRSLYEAKKNGRNKVCCKGMKLKCE